VGTTLLPTTFTYDTQGRLATQTQGTRTTTFAYDARGFLGSVTDPLSRTVQFTNDLTGRRTVQTFPDLREAAFGYDGNGNLTALTPPGQPPHTMAYTPVNLLEQYTAPSVGPTPTTTQYQFNLAKQPTTVTRADGEWR
jgi:YD repeat-containing protein